MPPWPSQNWQTAIRSCKEMMMTKQDGLFLHAEDYSVFEVGRFEETEGPITAHEHGTVHVINMVEVKDDVERELARQWAGTPDGAQLPTLKDMLSNGDSETAIQ